MQIRVHCSLDVIHSRDQSVLVVVIVLVGEQILSIQSFLYISHVSIALHFFVELNLLSQYISIHLLFPEFIIFAQHVNSISLVDNIVKVVLIELINLLLQQPKSLLFLHLLLQSVLSVFHRVLPQLICDCLLFLLRLVCHVQVLLLLLELFNVRTYLRVYNVLMVPIVFPLLFLIEELEFVLIFILLLDLSICIIHEELLRFSSLLLIQEMVELFEFSSLIDLFFERIGIVLLLFGFNFSHFLLVFSCLLVHLLSLVSVYIFLLKSNQFYLLDV